MYICVHTISCFLKKVAILKKTILSSEVLKEQQLDPAPVRTTPPFVMNHCRGSWGP